MLGQVVHRFVRNPNQVSSIFSRVGNRHDPFNNTLTVLEDPKNNRKLYLIGTTHASTQLAYRTKELIQKEKPDSVFVQTNNEWWNIIKTFQGIKCQSELNRYNSILQRSFNIDSQIQNNPRGLIFKLKLYTWLWFTNWYKALPSDFHPFTPGLEMKFAIEEAQKLKSQVILGGLALDHQALQALQVESRMDVLTSFRRGILAFRYNKLWFGEFIDTYSTLDVQGGEAFSESIDKFRLCWFIKYFERLSPLQKQVLVDQKDVDLFYALYRKCPGKKIVAVVNQWHMPGIEAHWRHSTGTQIKQEAINPIGDFDLDKLMEDRLTNDTLRAFTSKVTKSEPATWKNYGTVYLKDNYEAERVRHVEFSGHNDPHMNHGLPYEYDENMKLKHH